jgi:hypothetical protein
MAGGKSIPKNGSMGAQPVSDDARSRAINVYMFIQIPDGDEPRHLIDVAST